MRLPVRVPRPSFPLGAPTVPLGVEPPEREPTSGPRYDTAWARREPARYARFFVVEGPMRAVVRALASPAVHGIDRLDGLEGAAIFAGNHHSHLDAPLLLTSIPTPWRHRIAVAAAADYFFPNRVVSAASALGMGAIPIDRSKVSRRSADQAAELLGDGWSLLIFPEGGRSPDGWGQGHRGGAAYLALKTGRPVVPVHLRGTGRILPKGGRLRPGVTTVTFGTPLTPADDDNAARYAARIEAAVAALADEAETDWWSARRRAASGATPPLTGPATTGWRRAWALGDRKGRRRGTRRRWPDL